MILLALLGSLAVVGGGMYILSQHGPSMWLDAMREFLGGAMMYLGMIAALAFLAAGIRHGWGPWPF